MRKLSMKIVKLLLKLPTIVILGITLVAVIAIGTATTKLNLLYSSIITDGFQMELLKAIIIWSVIDLLCDRIKQVELKLYRCKKSNASYEHYLNLALDSQMRDICKLSAGKLSDALNDLSHLEGSAIWYLVIICPTAIPFFTLVWKEWQLNKLSAIVTLVCVLGMTSMIIIAEKLFKWSEEAHNLKSNLSSVTVDNFFNIRTLKFLNKKQFAIDRLRKAQEAFNPYATNIPKVCWYGISIAFAYIPIILNIYLNRDSVEMISLVILFDYSISNMTGLLSDFADTMIEYFGTKKTIKVLDGSDNKEKSPLSNLYVFDNVDFDYGEDSVKFHIDHMEFQRGKRYHVTGESGQGKSTLANLIVGTITPTHVGTGTTIVPIRTYYVYQETELFNTTLRENILMGDDVPEYELEELFESLNMMQWFDTLPDGWETVIGEKGCKLSSGQKQRVNIIRAILRMRRHSDEFFILDEITSNLDEETEKLVIDLIDRECKSTLMVISHHGGFADICDNYIKVVDHKFVCE